MGEREGNEGVYREQPGKRRLHDCCRGTARKRNHSSSIHRGRIINRVLQLLPGTIVPIAQELLPDGPNIGIKQH